MRDQPGKKELWNWGRQKEVGFLGGGISDMELGFCERRKRQGNVIYGRREQTGKLGPGKKGRQGNVTYGRRQKIGKFGPRKEERQGNVICRRREQTGKWGSSEGSNRRRNLIYGRREQQARKWDLGMEETDREM